MMTIKQHRLRKGWSQMELAELSDLSLRTIQRLEKGHSAKTESLKALGDVFDVDFNELKEPKPNAIDEAALDDEAIETLKSVRELKGFLIELATFFIVMPIIVLVHLLEVNGLVGWPLWALLAWGIYLACQAFTVFDARDLFDSDWERRMLEKRLDRRVD